LTVRIALLSDIHGNPTALDAVLADARTLGVEEHWLLGDFVAIGPEPVAVLDRVAALERAFCARGNTDRYVVTGEGPPPDLATVRARPAPIETYARIAASFAWTRGYVTGRGWFDWLEQLPLEIRRDIAGVRILAVHAAPGTDDGEGVHPGCANTELAALLAGTDADVVFVGHTHEPMARHVGGRLVVNVGSVSNPRAPDLRASYVVLEAASAGVVVEHRRVAYDHAAFCESVRRSRHPAAGFILKHQSGGMCARPPHPDQAPLALGTPTHVPARPAV
jgi:putative phosphoesterase